MLKIKTFFLLFSLISLISLFSPPYTSAVIQNLNGLTPQYQFFLDDMNVTITSPPGGNTHILGWQGLLPISRGGTGAMSFAEGSIPFISGGVFSESPKLRWDGYKLILDQSQGESAGMMFINAQDPLTTTAMLFNDYTGWPLFQVTYEVEAPGLFLNNLDSRGLSINQLSGRVVIGNAGYSEFYTPEGTLQVVEEPDFSTLYLGSSGLVGLQHTGCLVIGDSDGVGVTYITANDGVLSASTAKPSICQ